MARSRSRDRDRSRDRSRSHSKKHKKAKRTRSRSRSRSNGRSKTQVSPQRRPLQQRDINRSHSVPPRDPRLAHGQATVTVTAPPGSHPSGSSPAKNTENTPHETRRITLQQYRDRQKTEKTEQGKPENPEERQKVDKVEGQKGQQPSMPVIPLPTESYVQNKIDSIWERCSGRIEDQMEEELRKAMQSKLEQQMRIKIPLKERGRSASNSTKPAALSKAPPENKNKKVESKKIEDHKRSRYAKYHDMSPERKEAEPPAKKPLLSLDMYDQPIIISCGKSLSGYKIILRHSS